MTTFERLILTIALLAAPHAVPAEAVPDAAAPAGGNPLLKATVICPGFVPTYHGLVLTLDVTTRTAVVIGDPPVPSKVTVDPALFLIRERRIDGTVRPWTNLSPARVSLTQSSGDMQAAIHVPIPDVPGAIYQFDLDATRAVHVAGSTWSQPGSTQPDLIAQIHGGCAYVEIAPVGDFVFRHSVLEHPGVTIAQAQQQYLKHFATAAQPVPDIESSPRAGLGIGDRVAIDYVGAALANFPQKISPDTDQLPPAARVPSATPWIAIGDVIELGGETGGASPGQLSMQFDSLQSLHSHLTPGDPLPPASPSPAPAPTPSATGDPAFGSTTPVFEPAGDRVGVALDVRQADGVIDPSKIDLEARRIDGTPQAWYRLAPLSTAPVTSAPPCDQSMCVARIAFASVPRVAGAVYEFKLESSNALAPLPSATAVEVTPKDGLSSRCRGCPYLEHAVTTLRIGSVTTPDTELAALAREYTGRVARVTRKIFYEAQFPDQGPRHATTGLLPLVAGARIRVGKILRTGTRATADGADAPTNMYATDALELDIPESDAAEVHRRFYFASAATVRAALRVEQ
jgi:hypothetical protein